MSEFYDEMAAMAVEMLTEFGFELTVRGEPTAADPVTGLGGGDGETRTMRAVMTKNDQEMFPDKDIRSTDRTLITSEQVNEGEQVKVNGEFWTVIAANHLKPDNATHLISTVVARG